MSEPGASSAPRPTGPVEIALLGLLGFALVAAARFRSFGLDFFTFILIVTALGVGVVLALHAHRVTGWTLSRVTWAWLLAWVLALFVNVFTAVSPETGFHFGLFLLVPPAAFLIVVTVLATRHGAWLLAVVLVGFVSLAVGAMLLDEVSGRWRSAGLLSDPNNLAAFCYLVWLATFGALCGHGDSLRRRDWWLGGAVLLLAALGVILTRSRAGFLILVVGAALMMLVTLPRRRPWPVLLLGSGSLVLVWLLGSLSSRSIGDRLVATATQTDTFGTRWALIEGALRIYLEYPVTGAGLGSFRLLYPMFRPLTDQTTAAYFVHNDYLQLLAEGGPLLLLLAVVPVGVLAFLGLRLALSCSFEQVAPRHWTALGIAVGLGGAAAQMTVTFLVYLPIGGLLVGIMAGALLALGSETEPRRRTLRGRWPGLVATLALLPVIAGLVLDGVMLGVLQDQLGFPGAKQLTGNARRQYTTCRMITDVNPARSLPWLCQAMLAEHFSERGERPEYWRLKARAAFDRALASDPLNPRMFLEYAGWLRRHGGSEQEVIDLYLQALVLDPVHPGTVDALLETYTRLGDPASRYGVLRNVVWPRAELAYRLNPPKAMIWIDELLRTSRALGDDAFAAEVERQRERLSTIRSRRVREHAF